MVLYFKGNNTDNFKGDIEFSKNINALQNHSPFLNRFIKKVLKIFQAYGNSIARPMEIP